MPKKAQPNGFYFFMKEVKNEEEGRGIRHDMVSIQSIAGPRWQALTPEEKSYYNQMAKDNKAMAKNDRDHKYTSLGTSIAQVDSQQRERQEREQLMINTIHNDCSIGLEALKRKPFYLCHVNYQYMLLNSEDDTFYAPCEIALIEFTLNEGITKELHMIVDAGPLPMGLRAECTQWAKDTHGIYHRTEENEQKERDMIKVYSNIINFMKKEPNGSGRSILPPLYTMGDSHNHHHYLSAVESCMTFLCKASRNPHNLFRIFKLPYLFHKLMENFDPTGGVGFTIAVLEGQILTDKFGHAEGIACEYHESIDRVQFCSLSMVKRWMFTITDFICKRAGITMEPGKHLPKSADINPWENVENKRPQTVVREDKPATENRATGWATKRTEKSVMADKPGTTNGASGWVTQRMDKLGLEDEDDEDAEDDWVRAKKMVPPRNTIYAGPPQRDDSNFPQLGRGRGARIPSSSIGVWSVTRSGRGNPA